MFIFRNNTTIFRTTFRSQIERIGKKKEPRNKVSLETGSALIPPFCISTDCENVK